MSLSTQSNSTPSHFLPPEIMNIVILYATSACTQDPVLPLDQCSFQPRVRGKPLFQTISGLSSTNHAIRGETLAVWFSVLIIRQPQDWDTALRMKICKHVREVRILAPALVGSTHNNVIVRFPELHTVFVDAHDDFVLNPAHNTDATQPIGRYRFVIPSLPKTLRRLWITNAHGPDARLIQILCQQCPCLKELWIERCTQFGPRVRSSAEHSCTFWAHFPNDHDAYFAAIGVEEYARLLGMELAPLELEQLHMGLYLTPFEAIEDHKLHNQAMPIQGHIWGPVCPSCTDCFSQATYAAEQRATEVLARLLPSLKQVSWACFFTENKTGRSLYGVMRNSQGDITLEHKITS